MADPNLSVSLRNIDCMSDSSEEPDRISNFNVVKRFVYIPDKVQSVAYRAKIKKTVIAKSLVHYMGWNRRHDEWVSNRMFHNFTFFEIKNAWGLIRSDFGHNEEIKNFFAITRCFEGVPPPQSLIFLDAGQLFWQVRYLLNKTR